MAHNSYSELHEQDQFDAELDESVDVRDMAEALHQGDDARVESLLEDVHAADQAELFDNLSSDNRQKLASILSDHFDHEILPDLSAAAADDVLEGLGVENAAEAIAQLDTDDAVHVMEEMTDAGQAEILGAVPKAYREELIEGLSYPEQSAGRLMRKNLVSVPEYWKVGDVIDYMREHGSLPNNFYVVYAVDVKHRPTGRITLGRIMQSPRGMALTDITDSDVYPVKTDTDQEEVAHKFSKYGLVEAPVTNEQGRLVGTITVDDVVDVLQEEDEEDFLLAAGLKAQDIHDPLQKTVSQRFPWLFINLITALAASIVIGMFAGTIEQMVSLAVLMPMVASMGGNAGTQSVTVAVRALATRQLKAGNGGKLVRKELLVGLMNGLGLALIMAGGAYYWYTDMSLALVFGAATLATLTIAGIAGALIPMILDKMGVDPAVSSGVFLTTVTDIAGFLAFLGLASLWLF